MDLRNEQNWLIINDDSWLGTKLSHFLKTEKEFSLFSFEPSAIKKIQQVVYVKHDKKISTLPFEVLELCRKYEIHFTYVTSMFDSNFMDEIMNIYDDILNVRLGIPMTDELFSKENLLYKVIHGSISPFISQDCISVLSDIFPVLVDMCLCKKVGTVNLTNSGTIDDYEIGILYKKFVDETHTIVNVPEKNIFRPTTITSTTTTQSIKVQDVKESIVSVLQSVSLQKRRLENERKNLKQLIDTLVENNIIWRTQNFLCIENDLFVKNNVYDYSSEEIEENDIIQLICKNKNFNIGLIYLGKKLHGFMIEKLLKKLYLCLDLSRPLFSFSLPSWSDSYHLFFSERYYTLYCTTNEINKEFIAIPNEKLRYEYSSFFSKNNFFISKINQTK